MEKQEQQPPLSEPISGRPTHVRYTVVGLATLMAVLLYLDRFCLSILEVFIREDLGLQERHAGYATMAFFWAYALGQVPAGWLSDRFGARAMLSLYVLLWSLFTGLMGLANGLVALIIYRFGCGLAQAGAYPTAAGMVSKWVPFSARARASSVISTGGRIGGFLAPLLTAYLLVVFTFSSQAPYFTRHDVLDTSSLDVKLKDGYSWFDPLVQAVARGMAQQSNVSLTEPEQSTEYLVAGLNEVLKRRDLYERVKWQKYDLGSEAIRLAQVPADELSEEQLVRRNRLLLEAAFPKSLRKLYGTAWRPVVLVYGIAGLVVAGLFWVLVRNRPQGHPAVNTAELRLIEQTRPAAATSPHGHVGALPFRQLVLSRNLWLSSLSQFGTNFGWIFIMTYFARFLSAHNVPVVQRGWMAALPVVIGMVGMLYGGWLTDRLTRAYGLRWGRRLPWSLSRFSAMAAFLACVWWDSPWAVTAALCVAALSTDLGTASVWAFNQDVGGRHVGSVLGWGNMWGSVGAAVSTGLLAGVGADVAWSDGFVACAGAYLLAGVAALGVDATVPVAPEEK